MMSKLFETELTKEMVKKDIYIRQTGRRKYAITMDGKEAILVT